MHEIGFIRDLAMVMLTAGMTTFVFHGLRLPVLPGYILAGVLIGPHTPGVLVADSRTIRDISNLGVVLLMFTLGLEFSVRRLRRLGAGVLLVAIVEVTFMLWLGYMLGTGFGWRPRDALFLGAMVSLSSTMVAARALSEHGLRQRPFARMVIGLLVAEDMLAILILTLLTAVAIGGTVKTSVAFGLIGNLILFVIAGMLVGLLLLPRLVDYVASFGDDEMLLISVLGLCFGSSLLAARLGFSGALGAFLVGGIIAEAQHAKRVVKMVEPLRNMFAALFFVTIGLKIDPVMVMHYALLALPIAAVVIVGKTVVCGAGCFFVGNDVRSSLRIGLSMAQIGEFSFVIASLGLSLGAVSHFIYPVIVATALICMMASPYLTRSTGMLIKGGRQLLPWSLRLLITNYSQWVANLKPITPGTTVAMMFRRLLWHILINILLVITLFSIGAYINAHNWTWFSRLGINRDMRHTFIWSVALVLSLPFLVAIYRKAEALGMLLAELGVRERFVGGYTRVIRQVLARLIPVAILLLLTLLISALVSTIMPPRRVALLVGGFVLILALVLWRSLIKLHVRLQSALRETLEHPDIDVGDP